MFGHIIPEHDHYWRNFTKLLKIMDYFFSPVCTQDESMKNFTEVATL
jgi:hypothetical protein